MSVQLDWENLPFSYQKTNGNVRCQYKDGKWGALEYHESEFISIHIAATALHYSQECFEGLKAFRGVDGKIRIFRWQENLKRMNRSADYILMPQVPEKLFEEALLEVIKKNIEYVPPYGTGASLYIRPLLIGTEARVGLNPSTEYMLVMFVTPVGPYFKSGFNPSSVIVERDSDRSAPLGTGHIKVGGNYAASVKVTVKVHEMGYSSALYLDPKEKKYIDECGPANFFAIRGNSYITPESHSVLPSITNMSLQVLAKDMGMTVEKRQVAFDELSSFDEVGQCGTAAVISPIGSIYDPVTQITYKFGKDNKPGEKSVKLYNTLIGIQYGNSPDPYGWITVFE